MINLKSFTAAALVAGLFFSSSLLAPTLAQTDNNEETSADSESIQIGLSNEVISITSSFDGTDLVIFGSVEGVAAEDRNQKHFDIALALSGPRSDLTTRRKDRVMGLWINSDAQSFSQVPASYSLAASKPLDQLAAPDVLGKLQLGVKYLQFTPHSEVKSTQGLQEFHDAVVRLKINSNLYVEDFSGVEFLSPTLFRARVKIPANIPIGEHKARAYLFKKGGYVFSQAIDLTVRKTGFEQFTYKMAHEYSFLYGVFAVLMAIFTGWLASVIFKKD